ncbi:MAG: hypothetical protein PHN51_12050 [Candidatus Nanopelagicales bacterium]|nr:hypothetical protein [Candidatus Nanopelagicales bacterium]
MMPTFPTSSSKPGYRDAGPISTVETISSQRPAFDPAFVLAVHELLDKFPALMTLRDKYRISLFKCLTAPMVEALDRESTGMLDYVEESCSFLELVELLSVFYSTNGDSYLDTLMETLVKIRVPPNYDPKTSLIPETMAEYFVANQHSQKIFLAANPHIFGLYVYVFFWTLTKYKAGT